jgi:hypothetical protein
MLCVPLRGSAPAPSAVIAGSLPVPEPSSFFHHMAEIRVRPESLFYWS